LAASGVGCKERGTLRLPGFFGIVMAGMVWIKDIAFYCYIALQAKIGRIHSGSLSPYSENRGIAATHIRGCGQMRLVCNMKLITLILTLGTTLALSSAFGARKEKADKADKVETATATESKASPADTAFIKKAADGGMTEVELGKVAEKNGQKDDVKGFGSHMVKDHGKANDELKSVASKMNVTPPDKVSAEHQAKIDKMSKMSGAAFDTAYVKEMVASHEKTIAMFEAAKGKVGNEDLKKFIDDTLPVIKMHLEMAKKMQTAK
jgi:putative membrane protein